MLWLILDIDTWLFQSCENFLMLGTQNGEVKMYNVQSAEVWCQLTFRLFAKSVWLFCDMYLN